MDLSRRRLLRLSALGTAGLAGCASSYVITPERPGGVGTSRATESPHATDSPTEHPLPEPEDHCSADPAIETDDPLAVDFDARARVMCGGEPLDTFETLDHWSADAGTLAADEEHVLTGSQSARVEASADDVRARIVREFPGGLDLSTYHLSLAVTLDAPATEGIVVRLDAPDHENVLLMGDHVWQSGWLHLDLGPWREIGSPDLTDVRAISIQMYTGGDTEARFNVDSLRRHERTGTGRVMLTFNNSFVSQYEQVFPAMRERGVRGVVSVIPGSTGWDRKISLSGLREMRDAGWDVVSSPRQDGNLRALGPDEQTARIRESKQWLVDNGFVQGADVLVWPGGQYDQHGLQVASRYHHLGFAGGRSTTGSLTEPLVVGRLDGTDVETVERAIDFAAKYDQLLALSYHEVGNMFSGIAKEWLLEPLDYALGKDLEVVTATDVVQSMR